MLNSRILSIISSSSLAEAISSIYADDETGYLTSTLQMQTVATVL